MTRIFFTFSSGQVLMRAGGQVNACGQMVKPVNVVILFGNVNHINSKLQSNKKIDDILKDEMPNPRALSLTWIDEDGIITTANIDSFQHFSISKNNVIKKDYLSKYQEAGIVNNKYHIYLGKALEYELELDFNGYLCKFYYDELGEQRYIVTTHLPKKTELKLLSVEYDTRRSRSDI